MCREVKSHKIRINVYKEQLENIRTDPEGSGDSNSICTYLEGEMATSNDEYEKSQKRLLNIRGRFDIL